jgi:hypothetical protein
METVIGVGGFLVIVLFFFDFLPKTRNERAMRASNEGKPTTTWWVLLSTTVIIGAVAINHY